jgi:ADP-dependent NAD(P)H-hydrate dehydratase / NAD(P)H-hydrate epimerase
MLKVFSTEQVKGLDDYTIKHEPIDSQHLMERAAGAMSLWLKRYIPKSKPLMIISGPGNNGGDGLVIARIMLESGYQVSVCMLDFTSNLSSDCQINLKRFKETNAELFLVDNVNKMPDINPDAVIIDAIFGAGLTRPVTGFPAEIIDFINQLNNTIIAVDIPSGLMGEDNSLNSGSIIYADYTLTLQFPKLAFFFPENDKFVGRWDVIEIGLHPQAIVLNETPYYFLQDSDIQARLKPRQRFAHKGNFGHALLIAGSYGMAGAAILSAKSCLRSGVGLVTVHVPKALYEIMQISVPEAMLSIDQSDFIFTEHPDLNGFNAIGIGPGLGQKANTKKAIEFLLNTINCPIVIDADALNCISSNPDMLKLLPPNSIITPHPKEFERLFGQSSSGFDSLSLQIEAAKKYQIIIVFKNAFTRIAFPDGSVMFNSTGNPGMATAGSGDVLTGMILSFLAQGYLPKDAAILAVYLHGKAGDEYLKYGSEESLIASDIIHNLAPVIKELKL